MLTACWRCLAGALRLAQHLLVLCLPHLFYVLAKPFQPEYNQAALPCSPPLPAPKPISGYAFDDFPLVATKKCSYQQTDGG